MQTCSRCTVNVLTSPRRTAEDDSLLRDELESSLQGFEDVAVYPGDFLRDSVDLGVVLGAAERCLVLLHSEDLVPTSGERESDRVTTSTSKCVDEDVLVFGGGRDILRDASASIFSPCSGLRC